MRKRGVSIIGTGALGSVLVRGMYEAGYHVQSIYNRSLEKAQALADHLDIQHAGVFPKRKAELGEVIFLTVPDRHIEEVAQKLSELDENFSGYLVFHCSGNKTSAALQPMQRKGAVTGSFHPLQTFTATSGPADFKEIYADIEGVKKAVAFLKKLAKALDCHVLEISGDAKPYLHAGAVMASNYVTALMEGAGQIAELGGMEKDKVRRALLPLLQKSVQNLSESEQLSDALSGPIVRGDADTVAEHIKLLEQNPRLSALYKQLGALLLGLIPKKIPQEQRKKVINLLKKTSDGNGRP